MALTAADKITIFTILGIPVSLPGDYYQDGSSKETVNRNTLLWVNQFSYLDYPYQYSEDVINAVNARIDGLTSDEESRVSDLISAWNEIEMNAVFVKTDKVTLSYDKQRSMIKKYLMIIIPVRVIGDISSGSNSMVSIG